MNTAFLQNIVSANLQRTAAHAYNGECRFLSLPMEESTDEKGFYSPYYTPRTAEFISCTWRERHVVEEDIALQIRGKSLIELTLPAVAEDQEVIVFSSDRAELRFVINLVTITRILEIASVTRNGLTLKVILFDLKTDEQNG